MDFTNLRNPLPALLLTLALGACGHTPPAAATAVPASAATFGQLAGAEEVTVVLSDFKFVPARIVLAEGRPYRLRLVNRGSSKHDLTAPAFFRTVRSEQPLPADGRIALGAGEEAILGIIPTAKGTYPFECSVFLHSLFGMEGAFVVD
jgi:uncharacterized cupredoxin-like copper-binding protein